MTRIALVVTVVLLACGPKPATQVGTPSSDPVCDPAECGPAMGMPNTACSDGKTMAGPSGRCLRNDAGTCGWEVLECPAAPPPENDPLPSGDAATCNEAECGPAMGMPNTMCPDGKTVSGPTGRCLRKDGGACGWEVRECADAPKE